MPQDSTRDLTPVVAKKNRGSYMWLMLCMMYTTCMLAFTAPQNTLLSTLNMLIGGVLYLCLLKRGEVQALKSSLVIVLVGLLIHGLSAFVAMDARLSMSVLMLGLGALAFACLNSVLALGASKTASTRLNFSLVLVPVGYIAGTYFASCSFIDSAIASFGLLLIGLCFLLKSRSMSWEKQEDAPISKHGSYLRYLACVLGLILCFFVATDSVATLSEAPMVLCSMAILPGFWLGLFISKKAHAFKLVWLIPLVLIFTPFELIFTYVQTGLPLLVTDLATMYFVVACCLPILIQSGLKGFEPSPARLWAILGLAFSACLGLSLTCLLLMF